MRKLRRMCVWRWIFPIRDTSFAPREAKMKHQKKIIKHTVNGK